MQNRKIMHFLASFCTTSQGFMFNLELQRRKEKNETTAAEHTLNSPPSNHLWMLLLMFKNLMLSPRSAAVNAL